MNFDAPTLYTKQMSSIKRGRALFDPHPGYELDPTSGLRQLPHTRPGDVGYINIHGAFSRLFNVHLPDNDPEQSRHLPEYFEHLPLRPDKQRLRNFPVQVLRPVSVKEANVGVDLSQLAVVAGEVSLAFERQHGSFLAFFDQAWHEDVLMKQEYKRVLRQNYERWLAFAQEEDDSLRLEDLILVTGCDRARAWATAVCHSEAVEGNVELKVAVGGGPGIGLTCGMRWENSGGVEHNWGPSPALVATQTMAGPSAFRRIASTQSETQVLGQPLNTREDQCLFIRGFRCKKRLWPPRIIAAAKPVPLKRSEDDDEAEYEEASLSSITNVVDYDDLSHATAEPFDDILNVLDYILENSDADVAIAHEDDFLPYIENHEDVTLKDILKFSPCVEVTEYACPDHTIVRLGAVMPEPQNNVVELSEMGDSIDPLGLELFERQMDEADELFWENIESRKQYNSLAPLVRLPAELICKIATILDHSWHSYLNYGSYSYRDSDHVFNKLGCFILGHVCHALRFVILGHHTLWAKNILTFPGAEEEILARSGESPLYLSVPHSHRLYPAKLVQFMMKHLSRCGVFAIDQSFHSLDEPLFDPAVFCGLSLPLLQHFRVVCNPSTETILFDPSDRSSTQTPALQFPDLLDREPVHAPALRSLELSHIYIPFNVHNLTSLALTKTTDTLHLPEQYFLSVLRTCSNLSNLKLENQIPPSLQPSHDPTIFLPVLRNIIIDDDFLRSIALWSHLSIPRDATRRFEIRDVPLELAETGQYIVQLQHHGQNKFTPPIDGFALECYGQAQFTSLFLAHSPGTVLTAPFTNWSGVFNSNFSEKMSFKVYGSDLHFDHAVQFGSQIIDHRHIHYLELAGPSDGSIDDYSMERWASILRPFSAVHTLNAVKMPLSFYQAMAAPDMNTLLLPSLRQLWIVYSRFEDPEWSNALIEFLQSRQETIPGLVRLRIGYGMLDYDVDEYVSQLRAIVPCVHTSRDARDPEIEESWHGPLAVGEV